MGEYAKRAWEESNEVSQLRNRVKRLTTQVTVLAGALVAVVGLVIFGTLV